jgi:hypothetical protein
MIKKTVSTPIPSITQVKIHISKQGMHVTGDHILEIEITIIIIFHIWENINIIRTLQTLLRVRTFFHLSLEIYQNTI